MQLGYYSFADNKTLLKYSLIDGFYVVIKSFNSLVFRSSTLLRWTLMLMPPFYCQSIIMTIITCECIKKGQANTNDAK